MHIQNFINLLLPLRCVLDALHVADICNHDHALGFSAKVAIQALVACVLSHHVPDLKPYLVPLHLHDLDLVVRSNRSLALLVEVVVDEAIDDRCLAH